MMTDDAPTLGDDPVEPAAPTQGRAPYLVTVLFGLSLAAVLPPSAMPASAGRVRPVRQSDADPMLSPLELAVLLGRPTALAWRGRVALSEIDGRLRGLESLLHVFHATDGSGVLVCLVVVQPDLTTAGPGGATPYDLWAMACEALVRQGVPHERRIDIGQDAFLAVHGGVTAQAAWLVGDRLTTASVTWVAGDKEWMSDAALSIATFIAGGRSRRSVA